MTVQCVRCKEAIPEGRLKALPNATTCVNCSSSKMKRSITVTKGEGEDTYNDLIIMIMKYTSISSEKKHPQRLTSRKI